MHTYCVAGWPCVGYSESQLERIWNIAKDAAKRRWKILNQPGHPKWI
ncbi:protease FtsH-inhibitory lysogeny factor CIII [Rahnella sp. ChDrAdgB13]